MGTCIQEMKLNVYDEGILGRLLETITDPGRIAQIKMELFLLGCEFKKGFNVDAAEWSTVYDGKEFIYSLSALSDGYHSVVAATWTSRELEANERSEACRRV